MVSYSFTLSLNHSDFVWANNFRPHLCSVGPRSDHLQFIPATNLMLSSIHLGQDTPCHAAPPQVCPIKGPKLQGLCLLRRSQTEWAMNEAAAFWTSPSRPRSSLYGTRRFKNPPEAWPFLPRLAPTSRGNAPAAAAGTSSPEVVAHVRRRRVTRVLAGAGAIGACGVPQVAPTGRCPTPSPEIRLGVWSPGILLAARGAAQGWRGQGLPFCRDAANKTQRTLKAVDCSASGWLKNAVSCQN